ncbi:hypothetical protein RF11_03702 [Thelohanellus kitauei]|uniref:Uncharacterized protein n=1 Tax=Thelohanellus kitauei TaxID=669202 RepID=A0A0C2N1H6_THEKT|nr:hypothetical protein RF11_03702 [Thelohanellus kitauei]
MLSFLMIKVCPCLPDRIVKVRRENVPNSVEKSIPSEKSTLTEKEGQGESTSHDHDLSTNTDNNTFSDKGEHDEVETPSVQNKIGDDESSKPLVCEDIEMETEPHSDKNKRSEGKERRKVDNRKRDEKTPSRDRRRVSKRISPPSSRHGRRDHERREVERRRRSRRRSRSRSPSRSWRRNRSISRSRSRYTLFQADTAS